MKTDVYAPFEAAEAALSGIVSGNTKAYGNLCAAAQAMTAATKRTPFVAAPLLVVLEKLAGSPKHAAESVGLAITAIWSLGRYADRSEDGNYTTTRNNFGSFVLDNLGKLQKPEQRLHAALVVSHCTSHGHGDNQPRVQAVIEDAVMKLPSNLRPVFAMMIANQHAPVTPNYETKTRLEHWIDRHEKDDLLKGPKLSASRTVPTREAAQAFVAKLG